MSLGLVEGLNNTIRVIRRKTYGYRDEEYLKLKIIASFLPPRPENAKTTHTNPRIPPFSKGSDMIRTAKGFDVDTQKSGSQQHVGDACADA